MTVRVYEISCSGDVADLLRPDLEDAVLTVAPTGTTTTIRVVVRDAAALYGLLRRIELLGLDLLDLHPVDGPP